MAKYLIALAALHTLASPAVAAELLTNGDFETGTYAGWTALSQSGSNGALSISTPGTPTPIGTFTTADNPSGGNFYSVSNQAGPGAYSLSQGFVVPTDATAVSVSFQMFVNNYATSTIISPTGLDYTTEPNQHARVDILRQGADLFSTDAADIVANFYLGADDYASNPNPYTNYSFNPVGLVAGESYILRFAEVDNQLFFNQGVDNISVFAATAGVPEPATWAMMIGGIGAVGGSLRRRSKIRTDVSSA